MSDTKIKWTREKSGEYVSSDGAFTISRKVTDDRESDGGYRVTTWQMREGDYLPEPFDTLREAKAEADSRVAYRALKAKRGRTAPEARTPLVRRSPR